ncbi:hypothetical protein NPIL_63501, partial [Nephila pilipes]
TQIHKHHSPQIVKSAPSKPHPHQGNATKDDVANQTSLRPLAKMPAWLHLHRPKFTV